MSQQLQITGGAKVRDLQDVIIGTSGVLSSLAFNVANGVPKLDVNGKILVSQLPNSVMEYLGTWDASTNTPTLVNGTGNQGDVYLCNVAGTTNFGAGPITFAVGDSAIYSGTIWQKAGGATGTVTSVGLTSTGNDAITITGSPITTSGNINLGFAGTNLQYINGAGDLTTFPTLISSIGLTMPSAFSVANSPLTANGTIAVTGAGYPSQYIRGDGTLADFPTSGGGGSSVSYYLNGGTSQGTIGGVTYYEMSKTADTGTGVDFPKTGDGFIVAFLTDAGDPAQLNIPAGNWNYEIYASMSANGGTPEMYAELYVYNGTTFTLISTSSNEILYDGTNLNLYTFAMTVPSTILTLTDRLAIKLYATNSGGKTTTVHTQDSHLCQIITTFSTGITALNGLTAQVQYFATGTSGTDFNISSATATHTFNLPVASASNTGKLSSSDWSTFNGKVPYTGAIANVDLGLFSLKANGILAYGNGTAGGVVSFTQTGTLAGIATGVASIGSVSAGKLNIYFGDAGLEAAILDNSLLTADRTYNFPDASGTLALLESTQTFSGTNTFGFIKADNGVLLKNGVVPASTGYTGIGAGIGTGIDITMSGSIYTQSLYFQTSAAYIYTFPSASGTLALLEGTQTFSGNKTFTALTSFTFSSGTRMDYGPYLTKGSVPTVFSGTTTNIYSDATTNNIVIRDNSSSAKLLFDNSTQTFTFPAATGTIALTSNLSSYVPYSGATGAVNLGAFDLTVNSVKIGEGGGSISGNTILGAGSLNANTTGYQNTAIGYATLNLNTTGYDNTSVGYAALNLNTTGFNNTAVGSRSLFNNTTGNSNTAIGFISLNTNTTGTFNTGVGYASLANNNGTQNTAIGYESLLLNTSGGANTAIGYQSLYSNTSGTGNIAIGLGTLGNNTTANYNIAIGFSALAANTTGTQNISIGYYGLLLNTTGVGNTAMGYAAMQYNTTGSYNTAIGVGTLPVNSTSSSNTAVGYAALGNCTGGANVAIGYAAGGGITSGGGNTLIYGGSSITTGSYNTIIGNYAGTSTMSNNIVLADGLGNIRFRYDGTNTFLSGSVAIGSTTSPSYTLDVSGTGRFTGALTAASGTFTQSAGNSLQVYQTTATNSTTAIIRQTGSGGNGGQDIGLLVDIQGANDLDNIANFRYYNGSTYTSRFSVKRNGAIITNGPYIGLDGSGVSSPSGFGYGLFPYAGFGLGIYSTAGSIGFWTSGTPVERMRLTPSALHPVNDNAMSLGQSGIRWSAVWAANGTIQTSDEREKKDIVECDLGLDFISKLRPVSFKWKVGKNEISSETIIDENGKEQYKQIVTPIEGKRIHYGLIAQEVEELLNGKDFGGYIHDKETDIKGLRYDQFVPLLIKAMQEQQAQIEELKALIADK